MALYLRAPLIKRSGHDIAEQLHSGRRRNANFRAEYTSLGVERTACPVCHEAPVIVRHGTSYWKVKCEKQHFPFAISGHPMRTKREAWEQWEAAHGKKKK